MYIFLTPHIIENPAEADKIYQQKNSEILDIKEQTIKLYKDRK
jgi:general secretion pathway protein D